MNAGAYGGEMSDVIVACERATAAGDLAWMPSEELDFSYRHTVFSAGDCIVTGVRYRLEPGDRSRIKDRMDYLLECRRQKQPLEFPSAGSTFKRPEGSYASLLIEQCGLKGLTVGGAQVSEKHSGFVINRNNATFDDIMTLIGQIREHVERQTGYRLECEMRIFDR